MMKPIIPEAALGQHIAVLGKTGSGKTFAAKAAIVEPLLEQGRRVGIVDPTGAWWGLRSSRDGKGPGFKVLVLGGDHGDLPLPALGGAAVARLLAEQNVNLIADTSLLTVGERTRWFIDFAGTLYRTNRAPLHLVIDEAHNFAPQGSGSVRDVDVGKMLHAANTLASGGRSRGIRLTMITQRPQKLHKDTLTSADTLIAMRVLAPHDRGAVEDWIKGCGDMAAGKEVLNSLASLARGEGWVWYPEGAHLVRAKFPHIRTFDSSATPTDGQAAKTPKAAAEIDLTEIRAALADAVKEAEANDPKLLRAEIARLKREAEKQPESRPNTGPTPADPQALEQAEQHGYARGCAEGMKKVLATGPVLPKLMETIWGLRELHDALDALPFDAVAATAVRQTYVKRHTPVVQRPAQAPQRASGGQRSDSNGTLSGGKRRILIALAQHPAGLTGTKLSILTGISQSGGTWRTYLGELRSTGLVQGGRDRLTITGDGIAALGAWDPLPTGPELVEYWRRRLGESGKRAILDVLVEAYPSAVPQETVAERAGIAIQGGTWRTYIGELRGLELVTGRGELRASEDLFV
jgi:hypothetical protein